MTSHLHPMAESNEKSPYGSLTRDQFYRRHSVSHSSEFITNSRGLRLYTQWWAPLPPASPIGVIAVVHGFTGESGWLLELTAVLFAKSGFATCAIDHQGHGLSGGLPAHIPDIEAIVEDCASFFQEFRMRHALGLPAFLYGESLGGAIAVYITLSGGGAWDGIVLNGAMCGINPKFKPQWPLEHLLFIVAAVVPTWRVIATRGSLLNVSFKEPWKRRLAAANPRRKAEAKPSRLAALTAPLKILGLSFGGGGMRAGTAYELLRVCRELQGRFEEIEVPILIVHGGDDVVCHPVCVQDLYRRAKSVDKTIKVYPGMWHQLVGEPDDGVDSVFVEILDWLYARTKRIKKEKSSARAAVDGGAWV